MYWYRWYHCTTRDPKLMNVARYANVHRCMVIASWAAILEEGSAADERGTIYQVNEYTLAEMIGIRKSQARRILEAMAVFGLIKDNRIVAWEKRQRESDDSAARKRRSRAAAKGSQTTPGFSPNPDIPSRRFAQSENTFAKNFGEKRKIRGDFLIVSDRTENAKPLQAKENPNLYPDLCPGTVPCIDKNRQDKRRIEESKDLYNVQTSPKEGEIVETPAPVQLDAGRERVEVQAEALPTSSSEASEQLTRASAFSQLASAIASGEVVAPDEQPKAPKPVVAETKLVKVEENLKPPFLASKLAAPEQLALVGDVQPKDASQKKQISEAFEIFWQNAPRREQKKPAVASFEKAIKSKVATAEQMIEGIKRYAEWTQRNGRERQYISLPATWINKERWNDELVDDTRKVATIGRANGTFNGNSGERDPETGQRYSCKVTKVLLDLQDHPIKRVSMGIL